MRILIVALAAACMAGAAAAQGSTTVWGGDVRQQLPLPTVPASAVKQAEAAVEQTLTHADSVAFRAVRAVEVASVRHGPLAELVNGPVSVVCGQYRAQAGADAPAAGDYSWFFVAIKRGQVLWTADDAVSGTPDEAHLSCQGAGLTRTDPTLESVDGR
jgi:hypothetical protein